MDPYDTKSTSRVGRMLKMMDIFPLYMGFAHSNQRKYKSASSGVFSALTLFAIFAYFMYLVSNINAF